MLKPFDARVMVKKPERQEQTESGIILPDTAQDTGAPQQASVVEVGKDCETIEKGDYLVVEDVGAYGFSLSSNYNSRPRIAEYILLEDEIKLIRSREDFSNLILDESDLMI